jgi:hypothetical protein
MIPNDPAPYMEFLDMENVAADDLQRWKSKLCRFVAMQVLRKQKPLVLKSPTHTGRVQILSDIFPGAKCNPYELFSSTRRLWTALDEAQALQWPREEHLDEYVFTSFERMYRGFDRQRAALPPNCICDVRYEDLIQDPVATIQSVYAQLELGEFEHLRARIEESMQQRKGHRTNRHELPPRTCVQIEERWAGYFRDYGYASSGQIPTVHAFPHPFDDRPFDDRVTHVGRKTARAARCLGMDPGLVGG